MNTRQTRIRQNVAICGTRQTRPHSPKAIFDKNVTRLDTFARVIRHFRKFGASGHCLICLQINLKPNIRVRFYRKLEKLLNKQPTTSFRKADDEDKNQLNFERNKK